MLKAWFTGVALCLMVLGAVAVCFAAPGVSDKEILIGSSMALEGPASYLGIQTNHGLNACINAVNAKGGVNGRKIKVITYNDNYEPLTCVKNTQKLINEDGVFALTSYVGTPTSVKAMPVWTNARVPVIGFFSGAEALRTPFNKYNFHIRSSYYRETEVTVDALATRLGIKKIAIFYQYDAFGEAVKKGAELVMARNGIQPVAYGSFERNTLNIEEGMAKITSAQPEAVIMAGTYAPLAKFVKEAKKAGLTKTIFYTVSFVGPEEFAKALAGDTANCLISQVMPPHMTSQLPIIHEYEQALKAYYPEDAPNFVSLEAFANARVLVEGLQRAGSDLTREKFIQALETIEPGQMGTGLNFKYSANNHEGTKNVFLTRIKKDGQYEEIKDWSVFKR